MQGAGRRRAIKYVAAMCASVANVATITFLAAAIAGNRVGDTVSRLSLVLCTYCDHCCVQMPQCFPWTGLLASVTQPAEHWLPRRVIRCSSTGAESTMCTPCRTRRPCVHAISAVAAKWAAAPLAQSRTPSLPMLSVQSSCSLRAKSPITATQASTSL